MENEKTPRDPQEERAERIKNCQWASSAYLQVAKDAERRMMAGEEQVFCTVCERYKRPDQLCEIAATE
jgi:hypothetical protein